MICLAAGAVLVPLLGNTLTLAWTHSVEKILWEEDWRRTPQGLVIDEARVRGSGAGMEPPPEARLKDGVWSWKPGIPPQREVVLRRSGATADWRICRERRCRPLGEVVPGDADPVVMTACDQP
ncbi:DUF1850 domain-containing protein [Microvirga sp. BT291]|nr:DUF1850 domain-containing protein [Microvirga pudoricolor]